MTTWQGKSNMDPVVEKTMFRLYHTIFYMNLDKVSHNFCIKNDPIITDPSFEKPKLKKKRLIRKCQTGTKKKLNI